MLAASGPGGEGAALVVGCAVATVAAIYILFGFIGKRVVARFDRQDADNDALKEGLRTILEQTVDHNTRLRVVEKGHKKHTKILDRMSWVLEQQEAGVPPRYVTPPGRNRNRQTAARTTDRGTQP